MGRLAGFRYREIVRRLKLFGYEFHRQGAGSHEIWRHPSTLCLQAYREMNSRVQLARFARG